MDTGQLCSRKPITVHRSDDLTCAAQLMREKHIGYLVVVDSDAADQSPRPVGVLTDRDIVIAVVAREADPRELRVGDIMTQLMCSRFSPWICTTSPVRYARSGWPKLRSERESGRNRPR
jgi:signal-transduction protein with cAMP-binding, CBS, and nucleotidyltransferase domain